MPITDIARQTRTGEAHTPLGTSVREYVIVRPSGNDTALVFGIERDQTVRKIINDRILQLHPNVEQVGFIEYTGNHIDLIMAGNEFCGNAARAAAWYALRGAPGKMSIRVSGTPSVLQAGVDENGNGWAQMPIHSDASAIRRYSNESAVVRMEGITHLVVKDTYPNTTAEELQQIALKLLKDFQVQSHTPALGVMFVTKTSSGFGIRPVVFVKHIDTAFYETACGSGTAAAAMLEALRKNHSVDLLVMQPSGMPIRSTVSFERGAFTQVVISGPVVASSERQQLTA